MPPKPPPPPKKPPPAAAIKAIKTLLKQNQSPKKAPDVNSPSRSPRKSNESKSPYLPPSPTNSKKKSEDDTKRPSHTHSGGSAGSQEDHEDHHHLFNVDELKRDAGRVLGKRLKEIRAFEKSNPNQKMDDTFINEYLFQEIKTDAEEDIVLPDPDKSEQTEEEVDALKKRLRDRRIRRAYNRSGKPLRDDKRVFEENILEKAPAPEPETRKPVMMKPKPKPHPHPPPTKSPVPTAAVPNSQNDLEKQTAEARKRLKELVKERIQMGPDPEMLKTNKALERAVVQESLTKKALIDAATRSEENKGQNLEHDRTSKKEKKGVEDEQGKRPSNSQAQHPRNSHVDKQSMRRSFADEEGEVSGQKNQHPNTTGQATSKPNDDNDFTQGLELEEIQKMIKQEEALRKSVEERNKKKSEDAEEEETEDDEDKVSKKEASTDEPKKAKKKSVDTPALFKKVRGEQKSNDKEKTDEEKDKKEAGKDEKDKEAGKDNKNDKKDDGKTNDTKGQKEDGKVENAESKPTTDPGQKDDKTEKEDDGFEATERPNPPIEYQDLVYGNVRFLNLNSIRPLQPLRDDQNYDDMFGMIANNKWVKMHFQFNEKKPPPETAEEKAERKKKKKKKKKEDAPEDAVDFAVKLSQSYLDLMKDHTGVDYAQAKIVTRIPRTHAFTRPAREVFYMEVPLDKDDYKTDWKKVAKDTQKKVRKKKRLPEFLTSSTDPLMMMGMLIDRAELNGLAAESHVWTKLKPKPRNDYFDWMMEGTKPVDRHGEDLLDKKSDEDLTKGKKDQNEDKKKGKKRWFNSPPHFKPPSPPDSLFDEYDFCGYGNRGKPYFIEFTVPRSTMLYYGMNDRSTLHNNIKKPPGAFPGFALPRWLNWSLDQKLPQHTNIPPGTLHWSRGYLGQSLRPKANGGSFILHNPLDEDGQEYNSLHDEHCKEHMQRPYVKDHLFRANLINLEGEVFCTQKEQNQYRLYLRDSLWREQCERAVKVDVNRKIHQLAGYRYVQRQDKQFSEKKVQWQEKIENAKKQRKKNRDTMIQKYEQFEANRKLRLQKLQEERETKKQERYFKKAMLYPRPSYEFEKSISTTLDNEKAMGMQMKQVAAAGNRAAYRVGQLIMADEKRRINWQNKLMAADRQDSMNKWATDVARDDRKRRVAQREEEVMDRRNRLPDIMLERKLKDLWIKRIVRKYAMRWLTITRKRIKAREDVKHNSQWNTEYGLNETVTYLRQESGFKKFSNIVLNLFNVDKLKALRKTSRSGLAPPVHSKPEPNVVSLHPPLTHDSTLSKPPTAKSSVTEHSVTKQSSRVETVAGKNVPPDTISKTSIHSPVMFDEQPPRVSQVYDNTELEDDDPVWYDDDEDKGPEYQYPEDDDVQNPDDDDDDYYDTKNNTKRNKK